jgi:ABC-2 type transport system permease protein
MINREIHLRTMRFLVTKTTRDKIILGKFLGVSFFWFICLFIAISLTIPFSKQFYFIQLLKTMIFVTYFVSLSLFLSTVFNKPSLSMFVGIVLAIALPIIGFWSIVSENNIYVQKKDRCFT